MKLLGYDLETTGLESANDRITELGYVLWDSDKNCPIQVEQRFLIDDGIRERMQKPETAEMCERVSGITLDMLEKYGVEPRPALLELENFCLEYGVDYLVAHNGSNFDQLFIQAELNRHSIQGENLRRLPLIDTRTDLPFQVEPDSRKLKHLALDCGFINPFPHRAVFDTMTMLKVLSHYPLSDVIEYSKIPFITVRAVVSYENRELAKAQRFSWEKLGEKTYPKLWVKRIKQNQLQKEIAACKFEVVVID